LEELIAAQEQTPLVHEPYFNNYICDVSCQDNVFGLYYTAPRDAINPESLHPVLLNARGYIPCAEEVPSAVSEEALEQSRRLKKLGLDLKWLSYRTSKEGGRYAVGSD